MKTPQRHLEFGKFFSCLFFFFFLRPRARCKMKTWQRTVLEKNSQTASHIWNNPIPVRPPIQFTLKYQTSTKISPVAL